MEKTSKYKILLSKDALADIRETKNIFLPLLNIGNMQRIFPEKSKAIKELNVFPTGYESTGYVIEGLEIYFKPYSTYLIFFVVDENTVIVIRVLKDRMYWQSIIKKMRKLNR